MIFIFLRKFIIPCCNFFKFTLVFSLFSSLLIQSLTFKTIVCSWHRARNTEAVSTRTREFVKTDFALIFRIFSLFFCCCFLFTLFSSLWIHLCKWEYSCFFPPRTKDSTMKLSFLEVGHTAAATADDVSRSSHGCLHMHMYMHFFIYVFGVCIFATWFSLCVSLQDKFFPDRGNDLKVVALKVFPCFYLQSKRHVCFTLSCSFTIQAWSCFNKMASEFHWSVFFPSIWSWGQACGWQPRPASR